MTVFKNKFSTTLTLSLCTAVLFLSACGGDNGSDNGNNGGNNTPNWKTDNKVTVHELADPDKLNPITNSGASSTAIMTNIFQKLLNVDFETTELVPVLADSLPVVEEQADGSIHITYTIREEAKWDDGKPVTGKDVAFTMKALKNPKVDAQHKRGYIEFIRDIKLYDDNPKKLTYVVDKYVRAVYSTGAEVYIVPEHIYDPNHLMEKFTIPQLNKDADKLIDNADIIAFAQELNSEKWQREKGHIVGSGAFNFDNWETGKNIILTRKEDWWGNALRGTNIYFDVNVDEIKYQIVNDLPGAMSSLKRGDLEVMKVSKPADFEDLKKSPSFKENFNAYSSPSLIYSYIGINTKAPHLQDRRIRQALAHLLNVDMVIKQIQLGYGERTIGPVMPMKDYYNKDIKAYDFNIKKAKDLLAEAGVVDTDGDGRLDYQGKPFTLEFSYNTGNDTRKKVALLFKDAADQVGIDVNIVNQEWSMYIDNQKNHNFELYYGAWVGEHAPQDPTQLWHRESANGGSNYPSFGNAYSDSLIAAIKTDLDPASRKKTWYLLQEEIHEQVPYIFIAARKNLTAVHKRFDNADPSSLDPGYWEAGFQVKGNTAVQ